MSTVALILVWIGKGILIVVSGIALVFSVVFGYNVLIKDWADYRRAKKDIFAFVESYKKRCTGNNRFVVTPETLQDSFREYNTNVITKVWMELVNERVIVSDPQDQVWCVR